jgi:hypothetical protein
LRAALRSTVQKPVQDSVIDCFPASAIGRMLATDSIHPDQKHDSDDDDQNNC